MKRIHFTDTYLMNPSHPVTVNLIGGGGTGSFLRIRNRTQQSPLSHIARQQLFRKRLGSRTSMVSGKNESNGKDGHGKHIHYMHR